MLKLIEIPEQYRKYAPYLPHIQKKLFKEELKQQFEVLYNLAQGYYKIIQQNPETFNELGPQLDKILQFIAPHTDDAEYIFNSKNYNDLKKSFVTLQQDIKSLDNIKNPRIKALVDELNNSSHPKKQKTIRRAIALELNRSNINELCASLQNDMYKALDNKNQLAHVLAFTAQALKCINKINSPFNITVFLKELNLYASTLLSQKDPSSDQVANLPLYHAAIKEALDPLIKRITAVNRQDIKILKYHAAALEQLESLEQHRLKNCSLVELHDYINHPPVFNLVDYAKELYSQRIEPSFLSNPAAISNADLETFVTYLSKNYAVQTHEYKTLEDEIKKLQANVAKLHELYNNLEARKNALENNNQHAATSLLTSIIAIKNEIYNIMLAEDSLDEIKMHMDEILHKANTVEDSINKKSQKLAQLQGEHDSFKNTFLAARAAYNMRVSVANNATIVQWDKPLPQYYNLEQCSAQELEIILNERITLQDTQNIQKIWDMLNLKAPEIAASHLTIIKGDEKAFIVVDNYAKQINLFATISDLIKFLSPPTGPAATESTIVANINNAKIIYAQATKDMLDNASTVLKLILAKQEKLDNKTIADIQKIFHLHEQLNQLLEHNTPRENNTQEKIFILTKQINKALDDFTKANIKDLPINFISSLRALNNNIANYNMALDFALDTYKMLNDNKFLHTLGLPMQAIKSADTILDIIAARLTSALKQDNIKDLINKQTVGLSAEVFNTIAKQTAIDLSQQHQSILRQSQNTATIPAESIRVTNKTASLITPTNIEISLMVKDATQLALDAKLEESYQTLSAVAQGIYALSQHLAQQGMVTAESTRNLALELAQKLKPDVTLATLDDFYEKNIKDKRKSLLIP